MFNRKLAIKLSVFSLFIIFIYFLYRPPIYKRQLVLKDPAKSVQDSMEVLRRICESVEAKKFTNCFVSEWDSTLIFRGESLGKISFVSASNEAFKIMKRADAIKLLSIVKFLNRNFISGVVHDMSIGYWIYPYGDDREYTSINHIRKLYIWHKPNDLLSPSFTYYFKIVDRKEQIVLVSFNDVQHK